MGKGTSKTETRTREVIEELFTHPPVNEEELIKRLEVVDVAAAQRLLVDRLQGGEVEEQDGPLFLAVIGQTGIGAHKKRLAAIALDPKRDAKERLWASMALTSDDPATMDMLVREMGPDGMGSLAELSLFELLIMQDTAEIGASIATALETLAEERPQEALFSRIEACRKSIGATCTEAYGSALGRKTLAHLRAQLLALFVEEAADDGIELLERLRDEAQSQEARRQFQSALLRLRSRRIDPDREPGPATGYALVSNCDGQGGFVLLGVFHIHDGTHSVADLCIRAGGDVRDGFVYPRRLSDEVEEFVERARRQLGCHFVRVTLAEAAELVGSGVRRTVKMGQEVPEEARMAVSLFEGVKPGFPWGDGPCCQAAPKVDEDEIRALLSRPEYDDTWFFDLGDLGGYEVDPPEDPEELKAWLPKAAAQLHNQAVENRLIAMAEHMARWHCWGGEPALAATCLAAAATVQHSFATSPLVRVMLERSAEAVQEVEFEPSYNFGDPTERQHIKALFFHEVKHPTGRDLARLDLTEAAASSLEAAFELLPGERRPREDERDEAAYAIGKILADSLFDGKAPSTERSVGDLSRALVGACRLSLAEQHEVLMRVVPSLFAFVEDVCSRCPVYCFEHEDDDVSEVFFNPDHPYSLDD